MENQHKFYVYGFVVFLLCGNLPALGQRMPMKERARQFQPVSLKYDGRLLTREEISVLEWLHMARVQIDEIFLRQVSKKNPYYRRYIAQKYGVLSPEYRYFTIMSGIWDRLESYKVFLPDFAKEVRPPGAGFYPPDLTKEEFELYLKNHPDQKDTLISPYTVVVRENKSLRAVPYHKAYEPWVKKVSYALLQASKVTSNPSLKRFLELRARSFLTDEYYESEMAWMDLDSFIDVTIGPYEVYEDTLMGYKTAYEVFITLRDEEGEKEVSRYASVLNELDAELMKLLGKTYPQKGQVSPIRLVYLIESGGDARAGVVTVAYNLPNDERVRKAKGSKKVLLKNVLEAKFRGILLPIADEVLPHNERNDVAFRFFLQQVLMHELGHGVGPGIIPTKNGTTTVSEMLKDAYPALEELKADVIALYSFKLLKKRGWVSADDYRKAVATYVAGLIRSMRFGFSEAHGKGTLIQYNYLKKHNALWFSKDEKLHWDLKTFHHVLSRLLQEVLSIQYTGDFHRALTWMKKWTDEPQEFAVLQKKLQSVPVDIEQIFPDVHIYGED